MHLPRLMRKARYMSLSPSERHATPPEPSDKITIVIVDEQVILREGMRMILENAAGMQVVGEAGNIQEACDVIAETCPNIVLIDLNLGLESSIERLEEIHDCSPESRILILTGVINEEAYIRAADKGAMGVVLKSQAGETLLTAIRKVAGGESWFDRSFMARLLRDTSRRLSAERRIDYGFSRLTRRECEIVTKIGDGLVNKEIARALGISDKTVRNSLSTIYAKLSIETRLELAVLLAKRNSSA
jgi:DNA-binding NarL/FixJ family response regulator